MKYYLSLVILVVSSLLEARTIYPHNDKLIYEGRWDLVKRPPRMSWSGCLIKANVVSTSISVKLVESSNDNYYNIIIDGNDTDPVVLNTKKGTHTYNILKDQPFKKRSIVIYKRTEGTNGTASFRGLEIDDKGYLIPIEKKPKYKMLVYGCAVTSGSGIEDESKKSPNEPAFRNHYKSYSAITARSIDAENHTISVSYMSLTSWYNYEKPGKTFRDIYKYDKLYSQDIFDPNTYQPNIIVINLLQNDQFIADAQKARGLNDGTYTQAAGSPEGMIKIYKDFLTEIHQQYPSAHIICTLGPLHVVAPYKQGVYKKYVYAAVQQAKTSNENGNFYTYFFPFKKTSGSPNVQDHQQMADQLTNFIKTNILPKI